MFRNCHRFIIRYNVVPSVIQKNTFLTNEYKCTEAWNNMNATPIINKINVQDFYNAVDQNYSSKGVISAIDVDIFANALKDSSHMEELKDLLHKLRLSAETGNMLDSTQHATVRNYLQFGDITELVGILRDPLNFGVFLDDYSANILLDKLIKSSNYELAARVASLIMLQEEYSNEITCTLCQFACYKYITSYTPEPSPPPPPTEKNKKVEEIKIRVKYLRNPYFDDHFDIKDTLTLSGKSLSWMSEKASDNLNNNLQIFGWLIYKKYDKLESLCERLSRSKTFKLYKEVLEQLEKESADAESKPIVQHCYSILSKVELKADTTLEDSLKIAIENAINKSQKNYIEQQKKLFKSWAQIREEKLEDQTKRLDRARRLQLIEEKQKAMKVQEQNLWFFENEDQIDLQIEEKEQLVEKTVQKKKATKTSDDNYIPPEILPKRK